MGKKSKPQTLSLFEPIAETRTETATSRESTKLESDACPRCHGKSLASVRPLESGGTRYCVVCAVDGEPYYFTPEALRSSVESVREVETEVIGEGVQTALIETGEKWEEHWRGMPEFVQEDLAPWKSIYVHFESREDMERFAKLVHQKIGLNTRSIWYPEAEIGRMTTKRYVEGTVDKRTKDDLLR